MILTEVGTILKSFKYTEDELAAIDHFALHLQRVHTCQKIEMLAVLLRCFDVTDAYGKLKEPYRHYMCILEDVLANANK